MSSTKALLREFGKRSSTLSFPAETEKAIQLPFVKDTFAHYVCPADGWLFVRGNGTNISAEVLYKSYFGVLSSKEDGYWGSCIYPCSKGQLLWYAVWGAVTEQWIYFLPCKATE